MGNTGVAFVDMVDYLRSRGYSSDLAQRLATNIEANPNNAANRDHILGAKRLADSRPPPPAPDAISGAQSRSGHLFTPGEIQSNKDAFAVAHGGSPRADAVSAAQSRWTPDQASTARQAQLERDRILAQHTQNGVTTLPPTIYKDGKDVTPAPLDETTLSAMYRAIAPYQSPAAPPPQPQAPVVPPGRAPAVAAFGLNKIQAWQDAIGCDAQTAATIVGNLYSPHLQELSDHGPMRVPKKPAPAPAAPQSAAPQAGTPAPSTTQANSGTDPLAPIQGDS